MIEIKGLSKTFGDFKVLNNISLNIKKGDIYGIIGHSGAGKSTLLRCLNGLEKYDEGSLKVIGKEIKNLSKEDIRNIRKNLGMIFQSFNLLDRKTVYENIALPLEVWGYKKDSKPKELSGGQKQRVAIARALALKPEILLCDEATSALDPKTTKDILALLSKINKELKITIVVVTHQMEVVKDICENITLLEGGVVKAQGKASELFLKPGVSLRKFLGEDDDTLPEEGVNIRIFFPKSFSENAIITKMAREMNLDFSIVCGRLEKFGDDVLGSLVINVSEKEKEDVINYLINKSVEWEVI